MRRFLNFLAPVLLGLLCASPAHPVEWEKLWMEFDTCLGTDKRVSDRSAVAAYYNCRRPVQECALYLERQRFWYDASPEFRAGIDGILTAPPEAGESGMYTCTKSVPGELFSSFGTLTVKGGPTDAAVEVNGVFAGRLPLEKLEMPPGEYQVGIRTPEGDLLGTVRVRTDEDAEISLDGLMEKSVGDPPSEILKGSVMKWWRTTAGERIRNMWASDEGVVVMLTDSRTFRFFDGDRGGVRWETVVSLSAATVPRQAGDSLFWVSGTGMLNRIDIDNGRAEMFEKVGNGQDCLVTADGKKVFAAGSDALGGTVKAFDLRKGQEVWSLKIPEVPLKLIAADGSVLLLTKDPDVGSGTVTSIETATGRKAWERFVADAESTVLAVEGSQVFFWGGDRDESGYFLDAREERGATPLIIESGARPVAARLAGGHFFLVTGDKRIYAYDPAGDRLLWDKALGEGGERTSILAVGGDGVTLLVNESRMGSRKGDVRGTLVTLSRGSGKTLFSKDVKLSQQPFFAGEGRLVVPDQLGTAFVRDLERDCTAWQFRSTAPGMIRGSVKAVGGGDRLYLASKLQGKLFAFSPGECPPPLSLPDLPALEKPEGEKEKKEDDLLARNRPAGESGEKNRRSARESAKSVRRGYTRKHKPVKEVDYDKPPSPSVSGGLVASLPPLKEIPREEMVGKVTQPALLERIAMWCAEHLDEWVVPETDGRNPMGGIAGPFVETWILRRPLEYRLNEGGRYTFIFDKASGASGRQDLKMGFGVIIIDPVFVTLPGDRRAVSFGIKTDKGFVGFWDSIARAEITDDGTAVGKVVIQLFLPYARRGLFKQITREDLNGDGDPETIVRYAPETGTAPKEGQVEFYYILGGKRIFFQTEGSRIVGRGDGLVRETSVVIFEDRDDDGVKEVVMEKFSTPCCKEEGWPEKVTEEPLVYRLVNSTYIAAPEL